MAELESGVSRYYSAIHDGSNRLWCPYCIYHERRSTFMCIDSYVKSESVAFCSGLCHVLWTLHYLLRILIHCAGAYKHVLRVVCSRFAHDPGPVVAIMQATIVSDVQIGMQRSSLPTLPGPHHTNCLIPVGGHPIGEFSMVSPAPETSRRCRCTYDWRLAR